MNVTALAVRLVERAADHEQSVVRCDASMPVAELRAEVRREAKRRGLRIRTGMVDDVLAVVRVDALLWSESTPTMRAKLTAPKEPGVVA